MINLGDITIDTDFVKPKSFILIRSHTTWLNGRPIGEITELVGTGIIDPLTTKEIHMLPEGDSISGSIRIYTKIPVYTTRNNHDEGFSDEIKFHGFYYKVVAVDDYSDFGYYKVIAVRKLGS